MADIAPTDRQNPAYNKPNIFVVGVMKGGTSALHGFLCAHPEIFSGKTKEIHYFSMKEANGLDWYHKQFENAPPGKNYVDASPTYFDMMTGVAIASRINVYNPQSRILLIIRNPVERALSHFHHFKKVNKIEALQDMTPDEFFSRDFEQGMSGVRPVDHFLMRAINFSFYYRKAIIFRQVFGNRFRVVENASLEQEPNKTMAAAFRHVGVDPITDPRFSNRVYSNKSTSLDQLSAPVLMKLNRIFADDYSATCEAFNLKSDSAFKA